MSESFGKYLINKNLPSGYQVKTQIGKKNFNEEMNRLARENPREYVETISKLKHLGDRLATTEGLSVGLDDITPNYKERDKILTPLRKKFDRAATDDARRAVAEEAHGKLIDHSLKHPGALTLQVKSGARGNAVQYNNLVGGVGYAREQGSGKAVPWLITRTYSEGLTPADYWATTGQSVMDFIRTYTSVSEPGELSKKLINAMSDLVVTETDCNTHNGVLMDPKNPDVIDRFLARDEGSFKANALITPIIQNKLSKYKEILVRSPMTCEAADGVCQKCQGLDEKGNLHSPGINVGIRAAQAMAEPLTQFALNAKHGGRTLKSDRFQVHGISGFRQIVETPRNFVNKATLSDQDGKVSKVEKAPQGGFNISVNEQSHYVPPHLGVVVQKGDVVSRGDVLSEGIPKPDEVVYYKGLGVGRQYLVDVLKNIYKGQGRELDSRHFELLARNAMNHVEIQQDTSNRFIKGDVVNYNTLKSEMSKDLKQLPLTNALGETLGKEYFHFSAGTRVTPDVVRFLKQQKVNEVMTSPRAPDVLFRMKPLTGIPRMQEDWLARLSHRGLKSSILQAAHTGEVANIHGTHPIPAYTYGAEFGQGPKGKY